MKEGLASEDTMIWIWVGGNPVGQDWSLGSVRLFTLRDAVKQYKRRLRRAATHGGAPVGWLAGGCL